MLRLSSVECFSIPMMWALCWRSSCFMKAASWSQRKLHTYCFMFPFLLAMSAYLLIDVIHPHGQGLAWISLPLMFASSNWVPWHANTLKQEVGLRTAWRPPLHTDPCMTPPVLQVSNLEAKSWSCLSKSGFHFTKLFSSFGRAHSGAEEQGHVFGGSDNSYCIFCSQGTKSSLQMHNFF